MLLMFLFFFSFIPVIFNHVYNAVCNFIASLAIAHTYSFNEQKRVLSNRIKRRTSSSAAAATNQENVPHNRKIYIYRGMQIENQRITILIRVFWCRDWLCFDARLRLYCCLLLSVRHLKLSLFSVWWLSFMFV